MFKIQFLFNSKLGNSVESQYQKEISSSHQYEQERWASANLPRNHCCCCKWHHLILEVDEVILKYLISKLK